MTPEFLNSTLEHLYERTKEGKQHWNVEMKTSEYKEKSEKPVVEADGKQWVVDECYTAYSCEEHGNEFVMITYENIETCGDHSSVIYSSAFSSEERKCPGRVENQRIGNGIADRL